MHYLLFIGAFLFFAFIAPLKVTLAACALLLILVAVVRYTAATVSGAESSYGEAAKGVGLSFFFVVIAFTILISFATGTGISRFTGLAGAVVFAAFLAAYALGFKLSLGLSLGGSAVVSLVAAVVSTGLFAVFRVVA
jgi:hypothetical protein